MEPERWYWSLTEHRAVPAAERGRDEEVLGPYPSKAAAEDWKATVEARNQAWKEADDEWEGDDAEDGEVSDSGG